MQRNPVNPSKQEAADARINRRTQRLQFWGAILGIGITILGFLGVSGKVSSVLFPSPPTPTALPPPTVSVAGTWATTQQGDDHGDQWTLSLTQRGKSLGGKIGYTPNLNSSTDISPTPLPIQTATYSYQAVVLNDKSTIAIDDPSATAVLVIVADFETKPNCEVTFTLSYANSDQRTMSGAIETGCSDNARRAVTLVRA